MTPEEQYELETEQQVSGQFMLEVSAAVTAVLSAWVAASALGHGFDAVRALAREVFGRLQPDMRRRMEAALASVPTGPVVLAKDSALARTVRAIDTRAERQLVRARRLAAHAPMGSLSEISAIAAAAKKAGTGAQADTRWAATRAVSLGVAVQAKQAGADLIWVPERDACLSCLAYAGLSVHPGELFPAGLTYGKTPANHEAIPFPPLHPNCRCRVEPFFGEQFIAEGLKREAQRSVARGFSNFASHTAKIDAAGKLITRRTRLPKTVRARAARDVSLGKFSSRHNVKQPALAPGTR